jgi:hypothetical protein
MRLRTRVTLVSAALMAVVLAATGAFVYLRLQTELRQAMDDTLRSRAEAERLVVERSGVLPSDQPDDAFAQLIGSDGSLIESSGSIAGEPPLVESTDVTAPAMSERDAVTIEAVVPARTPAPDSQGGSSWSVHRSTTSGRPWAGSPRRSRWVARSRSCWPSA